MPRSGPSTGRPATGANASPPAVALQLREAQLRGILDSANEAIITLDAGQTIVMANRAAAEVFGRAVAELVGRPLEHLIPMRFRARHRADVAAFGGSGDVARAMGRQRDVTGLRADGEEFPISATISQAHVDDQRLYTVIVRDLTETRRAAAALHTSQGLLAATFDASSVAMAQIDPVSRRFVAVNAALQRLSGYGEAELLTMEPDQLNHPDDRLDPVKFGALLRGEAGYREEKRLVRRDGAIVWVEVSGSVVRDAHGRVQRVVGVVHDVTARRHAEQALRTREARQSLLVRLNDRLRWLAEPRAVASQASHLLAEFVDAARVGYAEDGGDGHTVTVLTCHARSVPAIEGQLRYADFGPALVAAMREGRTLVRADIAAEPRLTMGEREAFAALCIAAAVDVPLVDRTRRSGIFFVHSAVPRDWTADEVALFEDVAQRIRADVERARAEADTHAARRGLETAHAELQRLVAAQDDARERERLRVAREIHDETLQSLAAIQIEATAKRAERGDGCTAMRASLERIDRLARDAIDSTRRLVADLRPFMLDELGLVPALRALAAQFSARSGVACRVDTTALTPNDEVRLAASLAAPLYRIVQEALTNVAKHAAAGSASIVLTSTPRARLRLSVSDDGRGVTADDHDKRHAFGLLGMRERARALGGTLSVHGVPGAGTTIDIDVPLVARTGADTVAARDDDPAGHSSRPAAPRRRRP